MGYHWRPAFYCRHSPLWMDNYEWLSQLFVFILFIYVVVVEPQIVCHHIKCLGVLLLLFQPSSPALWVPLLWFRGKLQSHTNSHKWCLPSKPKLWVGGGERTNKKAYCLDVNLHQYKQQGNYHYLSRNCNIRLLLLDPEVWVGTFTIWHLIILHGWHRNSKPIQHSTRQMLQFSNKQ